MPELPEVETARKLLDQAARGRTIRAVTVVQDRLVYDQASPTAVKKALEGAKVRGSDRRGKYFWLKLNRKPWPLFHFGMSGNITIQKTAEALTTPKKKLRSLRLELVLNNGMTVRFFDPRRFGRIRLHADPLKEGAVSRLGYDALFNFPTPAVIGAALQKRKAPLKAVLLDQSLFAGVGNWVADEVLYQSRLSPHRLANSLSPAEVKRLCQKILFVIRKAVSVQADSQRLPKDWLFHQRWGKKKNSQASGGHVIQHDTVGGRTTAWVPDLQK